MRRKIINIILTGSLAAGMMATTGYANSNTDVETTETEVTDSATQSYIEDTLNLSNNENQEWSYDSNADAWILSIVSAVAYPEIEDEQGVSVCVPGAYVIGLDSDSDGKEDVTSENYSDAVKGSLVIDYSAEITSTNGQIYTANTAPVILNTGAAGYSSSTNTLASTSYAKEGYINVSCGNRGKQDSATDEDGNTIYTGDAPSCLVDQKNAARFVKYNMLLGNLPGNVDCFVSTGGSGGGAHAAMFAATSNNSDFYDYEIAAGAVGVYKNDDGTYSTAVTIDGTDYGISDGAWGCIAYSAITSLQEADMAMAFEYYMDTAYDFNTSFQAQMAEYLSASYMDYINQQNLSILESAVGFDLNEDGDLDDRISLSIEYVEEKYASTNGYGGSYLDLYLAEFTSNLQWYLDNLDYSEGWTWFDESGNAMSDEAVATMTSEDRATAFIEGRYAKGSSDQGMGGGPGGAAPGGKMGELPDGAASGGDMGELPEGAAPGGDRGELQDGTAPGGDRGELLEGAAPGGDMGELPDGAAPDDVTETEENFDERSFDNSDVAANSEGDTMDVGTPDAGTTQSSGSAVDSKNYSSYEEMLQSYQADIAAIEAGDQYGNNIVSLYNPLNYIGDEDTENSTWVRIVMGAAEGDMSMMSSLNLQIAFLNAGVDAKIEWQWDGGHVPSEIFDNSFSLYMDQMYEEYVNGTDQIEKKTAAAQTENGTATEATGTDISSWVNSEDITNVSVSLADAAAYRVAGASKSTPGFDVIDYGQEDYVFGDSENDARHWDSNVLEILEKYQDVLEPLFITGKE